MIALCDSLVLHLSRSFIPRVGSALPSPTHNWECCGAHVTNSAPCLFVHLSSAPISPSYDYASLMVHFSLSRAVHICNVYASTDSFMLQLPAKPVVDDSNFINLIFLN